MKRWVGKCLLRASLELLLTDGTTTKIYLKGEKILELKERLDGRAIPRCVRTYVHICIMAWMRDGEREMGFGRRVTNLNKEAFSLHKRAGAAPATSTRIGALFFLSSSPPLNLNLGSFSDGVCMSFKARGKKCSTSKQTDNICIAVGPNLKTSTW